MSASLRISLVSFSYMEVFNTSCKKTLSGSSFYAGVGLERESRTTKSNEEKKSLL